MKSAAGENPAGVGPPGAVVRSVRVAFVVGVLMMDAVGSYPEDRAAFKGEAAAGADEVLDPLGSLVAAVREQAMIGDADADVDGEEIGDEEGGEVLPGEEEERGDSSDVEEAHEDGGDPVDAAFLMLAAHAEVLLDLLSDLGDGGNGVGLRDWLGLDFGFGGSEGDRGHGFCFVLDAFRACTFRALCY